MGLACVCVCTLTIYTHGLVSLVGDIFLGVKPPSSPGLFPWHYTCRQWMGGAPGCYCSSRTLVPRTRGHLEGPQFVGWIAGCPTAKRVQATLMIRRI